MLKHDKYWNWEVKCGDKVYFVNEDRMDYIKERYSDRGGWFKKDQVYEVIVPQGTPNGILVKDISTNKELWGEHSWFVVEREWKNNNKKDE